VNSPSVQFCIPRRSQQAMAIRRKTVIVVVAIVAVILATAAFLVSILIDPDRYRPQVISFLQAKTGKEIEIAHIAVKWIPLSIRLDNFGSKNPKPFPPGYFLKAARIDAAVDAMALLHRQIVIKSITVQDPIINVISDPDGLWNFENPPSPGHNRAPIFDLGTIPTVTIKGGQLFASSLIDPSDRPGPVVFEVHNLAATLNNVNFNAFTGPASAPVATGDLKADSLRLGSIEVTAVGSKLRLLTKQVFFDELSVNAHHGHAAGELSFDLAGKTAQFTTHARFSNLEVPQLLARFPGGRGKMTGTMDGQVVLGGRIEHSLDPLAGIRGTGNVMVRNGEFPSLNSNENLKKMARFRDPKDAQRDLASFSSFTGDLDLASQRISSREINIAFYGVDLQCAGGLGLSGSGILDYQGVAKVMKKQGFFTNIFARTMHDAKEENGKLVFPIQINGTMVNPKFSVVD
jgi:uncharacterized protein involved in outer membrane biogenesis